MNRKAVELINLDHTDVALFFVPLFALLDLVTFEVLTCDKDQKFAGKFVRANIHTNWETLMKNVTRDSMESFFLSVLFDLDDFYLTKECENNELVFLIVGHEHWPRWLHGLGNELSCSFFGVLISLGNVVFHDLADAHVICLIESHIIVLKLIAFFVSLLVTIKVDAIYLR